MLSTAAEKGTQWVPGRAPAKQLKNSLKTAQTPEKQPFDYFGFRLRASCRTNYWNQSDRYTLQPKSLKNYWTCPFQSESSNDLTWWARKIKVPKGPRHTKTVRVVNLLSVVHLLHVGLTRHLFGRSPAVFKVGPSALS